MRTSETVPAPRWRPFCEAFSRVHRGWLVHVWSRNTPGVPAGACDDSDRLISGLPLTEIVAEAHARRTDLVILARGPRGHVDHHVRGVVQLTVTRDLRGTENGLVALAADGGSTRLRFRVAAPPEAVDGDTPDATV